MKPMRVGLEAHDCHHFDSKGKSSDRGPFKRRWAGSGLCLGLALWLSSGCVPTPDADEEASPTPTVSPDSPTPETPTQPPTPTVPPTPTITPSPTDPPTPTETPDVTPTQTPVPQEPQLVLSAQFLEFGQVTLGEEDEQILTVSNEGSRPLQVDALLAEGDSVFALSSPLDTSFTVRPGESQPLGVTFVPLEVGVVEGLLELATNDPTQGLAQLPLTGEGVAGETDVDQDGFTPEEGDCNDLDATIFPGATELCDGIDSNCDGQADPEEALFQDADGDGYGDPAVGQVSCPLAGWVSNGEDCNDEDSSIHPGAIDEPGDGIDADCQNGDAVFPDLNMDGWPDVVVANQLSAAGGYDIDAWIYWGTELGPVPGSRASLPAHGAVATCVADLNRDGFQDVVLANFVAGTLQAPAYETESYVYWGSASGPSAENRTALPTTGATDCAVGDANGDAWPDLAFAGYLSSQGFDSETRLYYGSASGFSTDRAITLPSRGNFSLAFTDVNLDGYADLLQPNEFHPIGGHQQRSNLYLGGPSGLASSPSYTFPTLGTFARPLVADLNRDGWPEVVFVAHHNNSTYDVQSTVYYGSASGFTPGESLPSMGGSALKAVDLNGDGWLELIFASAHDQSTGYETHATVYWGTATGFSSPNATLLATHQSTSLVAEDLNDDGWVDLAFAGIYDGSSNATQAAVYLGSGAGFGEASWLPVNGALDGLALDFNQDGLKDLLFGGGLGADGYETQGYLYWGAVGGFSAQTRTALPMNGGVAVLAVGGE